MSPLAQWAAFITSISLLIAAVVAGYVQLRQIHKAVNSNMEAALRKISELHERLEALAEEGKKA